MAAEGAERNCALDCDNENRMVDISARACRGVCRPTQQGRRRRADGSVATILAHDARGAVGELSRLTAHAALSNKSAMTTAWPRIS